MDHEIKPLPPKMNPEVKALWVARLKDPASVKTMGYLNDGTGMCCLGHLSEIHRTLHDTFKWEQQRSGVYSYGGLGEVEYLPEVVMEWAGFTTDIPEIYIDKEISEYLWNSTLDGLEVRPGFYNLSYLNDEINLPLSMIGELIERCL
jgi:hypothetical protein